MVIRPSPGSGTTPGRALAGRRNLPRVAAKYQLVHVNRVGHERTHPYTSATELSEGDVVHLEGRDWLVDAVEGERVRLEPARYRLVLGTTTPTGTAKAGAFRRYRPDAPRLGHALSTTVDGIPVSWQVADERLRRDEQGKPYLELTAERDYGEAEDAPTLPEHQLERALTRDEAIEALSRAQASGELVELVALEPGEAPGWDEAERYIEPLREEEMENDLFVLCGVDTRNDRQDTWLDTVKARLRGGPAPLPRGHRSDHDQIEEWDFRDGRVFASIGSFDDQASPDSGHGWLERAGRRRAALRRGLLPRSQGSAAGRLTKREAPGQTAASRPRMRSMATV